MIYKNAKSLITEATCKLMTSPSVKKLWSSELSDITQQMGVDKATAVKLFKYCCMAVEKTVKSQKDLFKKVVQASKKEDDGSDEDETNESVSVFNKIYRQLLLESNNEHKKLLLEADEKDKEMSSGSATVIKMIVKGNDVRFETKDGTEITPQDYKRLDQELKGKYDQLKPGTPFHTSSKSNNQNDASSKQAVINGIAKAEVDFDLLSSNDIFGGNSINIENVKQIMSAAISNLNTKHISKVIAKIDVDEPEKISAGIATMIAIAILGKGNAIFKGMAKKAKADSDKKQADEKAEANKPENITAEKNNKVYKQLINVLRSNADSSGLADALCQGTGDADDEYFMYADADDNTSWKVIKSEFGFMKYIKTDDHSIKKIWNMMNYQLKTIELKNGADQYSGDDYENKSKALLSVIDAFKNKAEQLKVPLDDIKDDINVKSADWFNSNC